MVSDWIDVSVTLKPGMVPWPGDPPVRISHALSMERGDPSTVSLLEMGAHTGTHMDAPAHFVRGGTGIGDIPLDASIGPARVIPIRDTDAFVEDFVYVSEAAAEYLAGRQVRLVGVDYLSVGGFHADGVKIHRTLLNAGIWIIEGLNLKEVSPGPVDLVCLPLKILGGDGAPARALVRPHNPSAGRGR